MRLKGSMQGQWPSCWVFILAITGAAISIGYFGRIPKQIDEYGGAYLLVYLASLIVIGLPLLMLEVLIGRRGRHGPIRSISNLAIESGHDPNWYVLGYIIIFTAFIFLSYFSVVSGWSLSYIFRSASGTFTGLSVVEVNNVFKGMIDEPEILLGWHTVYMAIIMAVVIRGVNRGHELVARYLVPLMLLLLLILLWYVYSNTNIQKGLNAVLSIDFERMDFDATLSAISQALFSLGLGFGAAIMYGSFLPYQFSLVRGTTSAVLICAASIVVISIVIFAALNNIDREFLKIDTATTFISMPYAFGLLDNGAFASTLLFIVISIAAIGTGIAVLEPLVSWLMNKRNITRNQATLIMTGCVWGFGIISVLSLNVWRFDFSFLSVKNEYPFGMMSVFGIVTGQILVPVCILFTCFFAGWIMSREACRDELDLGDGVLYKSWRIIVRFVIPTVVLVVFFKLIGIWDRLLYLT